MQINYFSSLVLIAHTFHVTITADNINCITVNRLVIYNQILINIININWSQFTDNQPIFITERNSL